MRTIHLLASETFSWPSDPMKRMARRNRRKVIDLWLLFKCIQKHQFIRLPASPCPFLDFVFSSVGYPDTGVVTRALDAGSTANKKQTTFMSCPVKRLQRPFVSGHPQLPNSPKYLFSPSADPFAPFFGWPFRLAGPWNGPSPNFQRSTVRPKWWHDPSLRLIRCNMSEPNLMEYGCDCSCWRHSAGISDRLI